MAGFSGSATQLRGRADRPVGGSLRSIPDPSACQAGRCTVPLPVPLLSGADTAVASIPKDAVITRYEQELVVGHAVAHEIDARSYQRHPHGRVPRVVAGDTELRARGPTRGPN
jgi:hypothetical protein